MSHISKDTAQLLFQSVSIHHVIVCLTRWAVWITIVSTYFLQFIPNLVLFRGACTHEKLWQLVCTMDVASDY